MTTQYGKAVREPSGGVVSRAVPGLGKLPPGWHDLEVMSVAEYPKHKVLLLGDAAGHVHAEPVADAPPPWFRLGMRVRVLIGTGPGFVVVRDVDRYQARDSETKTPLGGWTADVQELYRDAMATGVAPATTVVKEVRRGDAKWTPVLAGTDARRGAPAP